MTMLTISLPDDLAKALASAARGRHASRNAVVCDALRRELATNRLRTLRQRLSAKARAAGLRSDDAVFKAVS